MVTLKPHPKVRVPPAHVGSLAFVNVRLATAPVIVGDTRFWSVVLSWLLVIVALTEAARAPRYDAWVTASAACPIIANWIPTRSTTIERVAINANSTIA